jgi:HAD superfamily hydrolase (TIGR01509 family)
MSEVAPKPNPEAQLWLFDFDNTLAALEQEVDWTASRRQLEAFLRSQGIDNAIFTEFPSRNLPLYNALLVRMLDDAEPGCASLRPVNAGLMRRASAIIESHELLGIQSAAPLPGAIDLLLALRTLNRSIAIVTSNSSATAARWLIHHKLERAVGATVGRDSLLPLKPAPDMIMRALELNRASASDAVLVGDSEADLEAARRAHVGFFGVAINGTARTRLRRLGATDVFSSPADLAHHFGLGDSVPNRD